MMGQEDLFAASFGNSEPRQRMEMERRAAMREEPAHRAGMTRRGDRGTSQAAARKVQRRAGTLRSKVEIFALRRGPAGFIDDEIRQHFNDDRPESSYRKRRRELAEDGIVYQTQRVRENRGGSNETVWVHRDHAGPGDQRIVPVPTKAAKMRAALVKARDQFLFYERQHRAKATPGDPSFVGYTLQREALGKASVNAALAAEMEEALK